MTDNDKHEEEQAGALKEPPKINKQRKQMGLGSYAFTKTTILKHNNKSVVVMLPVNEEAPKSYERTVQCYHCNAAFLNVQGLRGHEYHCSLFLEHQKRQEKESNAVHVQREFLVPLPSPRLARMKDTAETSRSRAVLVEGPSANNDSSGLPTITPEDGRSGNRGMAKRQRFTYAQKSEIIENYEAAKKQDPTLSVQEYVQSERLPDTFRKYLSEGTYGWRNPDKKTEIFKLAAETQFKKFTRPTLVVSKAKYPRMENELYQIVHKRRVCNHAKVSSAFITIQAKKLMKKHYPQEAGAFQASHGWFLRFQKRKKLSFKKRQNKKKQNIEEKRSDVSSFSFLRLL